MSQILEPHHCKANVLNVSMATTKNITFASSIVQWVELLANKDSFNKLKCVSC